MAPRKDKNEDAKRALLDKLNEHKLLLFGKAHNYRLKSRLPELEIISRERALQIEHADVAKLPDNAQISHDSEDERDLHFILKFLLTFYFTAYKILQSIDN